MTGDDPIQKAKQYLRDHERLIAAAKASTHEAANLGLPAANPVRGVEHDLQKHLSRLEHQYAAERAANREMREAILAYGRRLTILFRSMIVLGLITVAIGGAFIDRVSALAQRNREAIRTSCTLLANAVIESGGGGRDQAPSSPAAKAQREITAIYTNAISRGLLTEADRERIKRLAAVIAKAGGVISIPNCNEIARHPERVRELFLHRTKEPARRSPARRP